MFGPLEIQLKFDPCRKFRIFFPFEISLLRNKPHRSLEDTLNSKICKKTPRFVAYFSVNKSMKVSWPAFDRSREA